MACTLLVMHTGVKQYRRRDAACQPDDVTKRKVKRKCCHAIHYTWPFASGNLCERWSSWSCEGTRAARTCSRAHVGCGMFACGVSATQHRGDVRLASVWQVAVSAGTGPVCGVHAALQPETILLLSSSLYPRLRTQARKFFSWKPCIPRFLYSYGKAVCPKSFASQ